MAGCGLRELGWLGLAASVAAAMQPTPAPRAPAWFVRVEVASAEHPRSFTSGVVLPNGRVAAPFNMLEHAKDVHVLSADGKRWDTSGVVGYDLSKNLVCMEVRWAPDAPIVSVFAAPPRAGVALHQAIWTDRGPEVVATQVLKTTGQTVAIRPPLDNLGLSIGGAVLDEDGRLEGMIVRFQSGVTLGDRGVAVEVGDMMARPQTLAALVSGEATPWSDWLGQLASARESDKTAQDSIEAAGRGDTKEALSLAYQSVRLDRRSWRGWQALGYALWKSDRLSDAASALRTAIDLNPVDPFSLAWRAQLQGLLGDPRAGLNTIGRALEVCPSDLPSLRTRAWLLDRCGRADEARAAYEEILKDHPDDKETLGALKLLTSGPSK